MEYGRASVGAVKKVSVITKSKQVVTVVAGVRWKRKEEMVKVGGEERNNGVGRKGWLLAGRGTLGGSERAENKGRLQVQRDS